MEGSGSITIESRGGDVLFSTESTFIGTSPLNSVGGSPSSTRRSLKTPIGKSIAKYEIKFPIFERIAQEQTNDHWRKVFSEMASGKSPSKMNIIVDRNYSKDSTDPTMKIGVLSYKIRKNEKTVDIYNNPALTAKLLKEFIRTNVGTGFDEDSDNQVDEIPVRYISESKVVWSKLKPKDRELRLKAFAGRYSKEHSYLPSEQEELETTLILYNISKDLPEERVKMNEAGEIVNIGGLRMTDTGAFVIGA